jgi:transposase
MYSAELEEQTKEEKRNHKIREVHRLRDEGKSTREIADMLDIGIGTVSKYETSMNRIYRANEAFTVHFT